MSHFCGALCPGKRRLIGIVAAKVNQHCGRHLVAARGTSVVGVKIPSSEIEENGCVFRIPGVSISADDDLTDGRITIDENTFRLS